MEMKMIGNKIAETRKRANMSQAELAEQLFISPQAVGKWERGESIPDIVTSKRLAEILKVDLNFLTGSVTIVDLPNNGSSPTEEGASTSRSQESSEIIHFSGSNLLESDFAGVIAHNRKFNGSALRGTDFTDADLTGSRFSGSDVCEVNFKGANLTNCVFSASDLSRSCFQKSILTGTEFTSSGMSLTKFTDCEFLNVKLARTDLRKTIFENCIFETVEFKSADLTDLIFDGHHFTNVKFHNTALNGVSFKGATLKNVSFRAPYALTNRYYKAIQTICFDNAMIDKLTYAALKGIGANLSNVTIY
ncbi:pentapeptide repeat-containing protein [Mucilaginibacter boryungensis]|uniref:Pentapeptide repeat-containing protein n=1 Tax=Mucilaginibacter boryungensis TaxID=768480 RepID=A0ABR9XMI3_9SPHI|nr:pentapeptide repeat-containing protein [Mucilaginibacter boryungensis]MBE9668491.1 pentapeptide repeat-containing protein [Mucilaginibacter boryungensis]